MKNKINSFFFWISYLGLYVPLFPVLFVFGGIGYTTDHLPFVIIGGTILYCYLRLEDDLRDLKQDKIAHPSRPFPKGMLTVKQGETVKWVFFHAMWICSVVFLFFESVFFIPVFLLSILVTFATPKLEGYPLAKSLVNQIVILPFGLLISPFYSLLLYGAFATYDLIRKIDPKLHPILMTPIHFWGYSKVYWFCIGTLAIAAFGAYGLGIPAYFIPLEFIVMFTLLAPFSSPDQWEVPRFTSAMLLIIAAWCRIFF